MTDGVAYDLELVRWYLGSFLGVYLLASVTCIIWFYLRRDIQPIQSRIPALVITTSVLTVILCTLTCFNTFYPLDVPCWVLRLNGMLVFGIGSAYLLRCWILMFNFELTIAQLAKTSRRRSVVGRGALSSSSLEIEEPPEVRLTRTLSRASFVSKGTWYMENRNLMSSRNLLLTFVGLFGTSCLPMLIATIISPTQEKRPDGSCGDTVSRWIVGVTVVVYVSIFLLFGFKMRELFDGFFVKKELRLTAVVVALCTVGWVTTLSVDDDNTDFPWHTIFNLSQFSAIIMFSVGWPLVRSFNWLTPFDRRSITRYMFDGETNFAGTGSSGQILPSLGVVLADSGGREYFRRHLVKEFNLENLVFWERVEMFRSAVASADSDDSIEAMTEAFKQGLDLYNTCVRPGSGCEVNLAFVHRDPLDGLFGHAIAASDDPLAIQMQAKRSERVLSTCFDDAQGAVFQLMESDPFQRFLVTRACADYMRDKARREQRTLSSGRKSSVLHRPLTSLPSMSSM